MHPGKLPGDPEPGLAGVAHADGGQGGADRVQRGDVVLAAFFSHVLPVVDSGVLTTWASMIAAVRLRARPARGSAAGDSPDVVGRRDRWCRAGSGESAPLPASARRSRRLPCHAAVGYVISTSASVAAS